MVNNTGEPDEEVEEEVDHDEEGLKQGVRGSGRTANNNDDDETVGYKYCSASIY